MTTLEHQTILNGQSRIIIVGGFLGAGKTAALVRLGAWLRGQNVPTRIIVGGSGGDSVDAIRFCEEGFDTQVAKGSFPASPALSELFDRPHPAVFLLEAPGSSAHLAAALESVRASGHLLAPLTVAVDACRALKLLGLENGHRFSPPIERLHRRQIEEASLLLLTRAGDVPARKLATLRKELEEINPAPLIELNARTESIEQWWRSLGEASPALRSFAEIDPSILAEADRALAAFNCVVKLSSVRYFDGNKVLPELIGLVQTLLQQESAEIAHLKAVLSSIDAPGEHAAASVTNNASAPELSHSLGEPIQLGRMILNLRAESDPEVLHSAVNRALFAVVEKSPELFARMEHSEHFRPEPAILAR